MTKFEFEECITKCFNHLAFFNGPVCYILGYYFHKGQAYEEYCYSSTILNDFADLFKPTAEEIDDSIYATGFWLKYLVYNNNPLHDDQGYNDSNVKHARLTALLLFEQIAITKKLYRNYKIN